MNIFKHVIARFRVPWGPYCYEPLGTFLTKDNKCGIHVKLCPYWMDIEDALVDGKAWCRLLDAGDDLLLDDQCKICNVNSE